MLSDRGLASLSTDRLQMAAGGCDGYGVCLGRGLARRGRPRGDDSPDRRLAGRLRIQTRSGWEAPRPVDEGTGAGG